MTGLQNTEIQPNLQKPHRKQPVWFLLLSFLFPMLFLSAGFAMQHVYPLGDRQILVVDFWHQYYPFLRLLHEKLQHGGSLLYTWSSGLGSDFVSMAAYYAASPLNLLTVLVPDAWLREAVTVLLLLKVGCAGLFFALFLKGTFHRNDFSLCVFSVCYALCSYMLGYYWNIIWLDTVALLPLVILGLVRLVRDGKCRLYGIALGLSLFSNFYIGLFTCIFVCLVFPCLCVLFLRPRQVPGRILAMGVYSLLGGMLAACVLLPAYFALQLTYSVRNVFPSHVEFYENWRVLLSNLLSFHAPTAKDGLPNLVCGLLSLVMLGPFLRSLRIRIREKVMAVLLLGFLLISCNCNVLNYLWHGMHFPNMLPFRFSFLFSFVLLTVGYRGFWLLLEEQLRGWDVLAALAVSVAFFGLSYGVQENHAVFYSAAVMLLYVFLLALYLGKIFGKRLFYFGLSIVMVFELFENVRMGTELVSTSDHATYPAGNGAVQQLLDEAAQQDSTLFYRTEMNTWYSLNDPALYGYAGLSQFSSMANVQVSKWMRALGLPASEAGNRYYYAGGTPVTNMFTGIRYQIFRSGTAADVRSWELLSTEGGSSLYRNTYDLPLGFWTEAALLDYNCLPDANPFENQNTLFRLATGVETPLFTAVRPSVCDSDGAEITYSGNSLFSYTLDAGAETHSIQLTYTVPEGASLYGYLSAANASSFSVLRDGERMADYGASKQPYLFPMGDFAAGETAALSVALQSESLSGMVRCDMYVLNRQALEKGYARLQSGAVTLTQFRDTTVTGTMTAAADGLCYFSIPYEDGWKAEVDGNAVEIQPVGDAMIAVSVTKGSHTITLTYCPKGWKLGCSLTVGGIGILLCLFLLERRRKRPFLSPAEAQRKKQPKRMTSEEIYEKSQSNDGISGNAVSRISASAQCSDSAADRGGSPFSAAQ